MRAIRTCDHLPTATVNSSWAPHLIVHCGTSGGRAPPRSNDASERVTAIAKISWLSRARGGSKSGRCGMSAGQCTLTRCRHHRSSDRLTAATIAAGGSNKKSRESLRSSTVKCADNRRQPSLQSVAITATVGLATMGQRACPTVRLMSSRCCTFSNDSCSSRWLAQPCQKASAQCLAGVACAEYARSSLSPPESSACES